MILSLIVLVFLLIISIIDWKVKAVPSIMMTSMIFVVMLIEKNILFGLSGFVLGWLLYESGYFGGIADVKVMAIIGLMVSSLTDFFVFSALTMVLGIVYIIIFKINKKDEEVPFLPLLFIVYAILMLLGMVG